MNTFTVLLAATVGLLLFIVGGEASSICPPNTTSTPCAPCDQFCNEEDRACPTYCIEGQNFCQCLPDHRIYSHTNSICVLESDCPRKPRPGCKMY